MPSNAKIEKQPSTESGQGGSEPLKQVQLLVEKKIRNLEKRKGRLEQLQGELKTGKGLNDDQKKAVGKYDDVNEVLEFFREFSKSVATIFADTAKVAKKAAKQELAERNQQERERLKTVIRYQNLLSAIGNDSKARKDFANGTNGAVKLPRDRLDQLDELRKTVTLDRKGATEPISTQLETAADRLYALSEGKKRDAVAGVTFKDLKDTLDQIDGSGYFNKVVAAPVPEPIVPLVAEVTALDLNAQPQPSLQQQTPTPNNPPLPNQYSGVNFIQESSLAGQGIEGDPAILALVPQGGHPGYPAQFTTDVSELQRFENGSLIPTQTFTNPSYANFQSGYAVPTTQQQQHQFPDKRSLTNGNPNNGMGHRDGPRPPRNNTYAPRGGRGQGRQQRSQGQGHGQGRFSGQQRDNGNVQ